MEYMRITDGFETALWIILSFILYKLMGYTPVIFILIFHLVNGLDEYWHKK